MFKLIKEQQTRFGKASLYKHSSGLQLFNVDNDSSLKCFNIAFKTPDLTSKGSPHCLEHLALCGSQKYPVRDPFMKMLARSFSNYMNALTGDDLTMYPFSTTVEKDYFNLMDVYLDSVFNPLLKHSNFLQECWRLGIGANEKLEFKGVVYNEMKGVMSDVNSLYYYEHQKYFYGGSIYSNNSGGDPKYITELTLKDLKQFHSEKYNPTNACVYTFGNVCLQKGMEVLNRYLEGHRNAGHGLKEGNLAVKKYWTQPKSVTVKGPVDSSGDIGRQFRTSISYLLSNTADPIVSSTMRIVSNLLLDGIASPMHKLLIGSGLGNEYTSTTGYSSSCYNANISIGLQGVAKSNIETVKQTIIDELHNVANAGFAPERINSVFHQYELALLHKLANFGLNLGFSVQRRFAHGRDVFDALNFRENLEKVRQLKDREGYLQGFVKEQLIDNSHRLDLVMEPSTEYFELAKKEEVSRLENLLKTLSNADLEECKKAELKLNEEQDAREDISILPCLKLSDVSPEIQKFDVKNIKLNGTELGIRETITNGVSYVKLKFKVNNTPKDLLPYLSVFSRAITALGTSTQSHSQFDEEIRAIGSISAMVSSICSPGSIDQEDTYLRLSAFSKDSDTIELYEKLGQVIFDANFENVEAYSTLLKEELAELKSSVVDNGNAFAARAAASHLTECGRKTELLYGFEQISFLEGLLHRGDFRSQLMNLRRIRDLVITSNRDLFVVCEAPNTDLNCKQIETLLGKLTGPIEDGSKKSSEISIKQLLFGHQMDLGVNYVAQCMKAVQYTHSDSPNLLVFLTKTSYSAKYSPPIFCIEN